MRTPCRSVLRIALQASVRAVLAALALTLCGCAATRPDPLAELLAHHLQARGGARALDAIHSLRIRVEIVEPQFSVTGDYRAQDGQMRIDVHADGARVFSEGIDARGAWQQSGAGAPVLDASPAGRAALAHGIEFNLFGLHRFAERGHRLELAPDERLDGIDYRVVHVRLADGFETWLYINPSTWMIERRRDRRALHPDIAPSERLLEDRHLRFERFCGVLFPVRSRQVEVGNGTVVQSTRVLSQECNPAAADLQIPREARVD